jgi:hypothetical protein
VLMLPWPLETASEKSAAATTPINLRFTLPPVVNAAHSIWGKARILSCAPRPCRDGMEDRAWIRNGCGKGRGANTPLSGLPTILSDRGASAAKLPPHNAAYAPTGADQQRSG